MKRNLLAVLALSAALGAASLMWAAAGPDLTHAQCPVAGGKANAATAVDHNGGKVYFCCAGCDAEFKNNTAKYEAKANQQLFLTGQAKQIACPLAGERVDPGLTTKLGEATVAFCCPSCKAAVDEQADDDAKLERVFGAEGFAKGFKVGQ